MNFFCHCLNFDGLTRKVYGEKYRSDKAYYDQHTKEMIFDHHPLKCGKVSYEFSISGTLTALILLLIPQSEHEYDTYQRNADINCYRIC